MTKNSRDILISLLALAVITFGVRYAVMREKLQRTDLHIWYQQENATEFGGQLKDASVQWGYLKEENAEGITYKMTDDSFAIVLDRGSNTSEKEARDTLRHEMCHVSTWGEQPSHGPRWQACMAGKTE
jgi:SprT-like family